MTEWIRRADAILATVFTALGAILLLGGLGIPFGSEILAVGLVVMAVLMLIDALEAPTWVPITLVAVAFVVLFAPPIARVTTPTLGQVMEIIAGAALLVVGILKLTGDGWDALAPESRAARA